MAEPTALASLVGDVTMFHETVWRQQARVLRPECPPLDTMTIADLDRVLLGSRIRLPYLEMVKAGQHVDPKTFTSDRLVGGVGYHGYPDRSAVVRGLAAGSTLLLRNVEHWHVPAAELTRQLAQELDRQVEAFVFVTPPGERGLATHRDDADVFVVQLHGRKVWQVHHAPLDGRWEAAVEPNPGPVALRSELATGEVLYLPRGAPHAAVGSQQGLSVHLSLTVRQSGADDLRAALREHLEEGERIAPRPVDDAGMLAAAADLLSQYRRRLEQLTPAVLLASADAAVRTAHGSTAAPSSLRGFAESLPLGATLAP